MRRLLLAACLALLWGAAAHAACPNSTLTIKDGNGTTQVFCVGGSGSSLFSQVQQVDQAGNPVISCNLSVPYNASTSGATQLVALAAGQKIYVCGFSFLASSVSVSVGLEYGTGSNCATGTGTATMPPPFVLAAGVPIVDHVPTWNGIVTPASNALCLVTGAGQPVQAIVYYAQQ